MEFHGRISILFRDKADLLVNLTQGLFCHIGSSLGTVTVDAFQICLILQQTCGFLADGSQVLNDSLTNNGLEGAVALT